MKQTEEKKPANATIPDKTTWESFSHHVHFPTEQNYFQNDAFAEKKTLPPIQCCFPQTPRDQAFLWIHNNIAFRGRGRGKNRYSYDVSKNAVQVYNFPNSFVQDCRKGASLVWEEWWSIDPLKTPKQTNKRTSSVSSSLSILPFLKLPPPRSGWSFSAFSFNNEEKNIDNIDKVEELTFYKIREVLFDGRKETSSLFITPRKPFGSTWEWLKGEAYLFRKRSSHNDLFSAFYSIRTFNSSKKQEMQITYRPEKQRKKQTTRKTLFCMCAYS